MLPRRVPASFSLLLGGLIVASTAGAGQRREIDIPFTIFDNRIMVDASINGHPGFEFIVDTGTNGIILTPQAAKRLSLKLTKGEAITGAGPASKPSKRSNVNNIEIGSFSIKRSPVLLVGLDQIRNAFHFPRLDGVLGLDVLAGDSVTFNMQRRVISLADVPLNMPSHAVTQPYRVQDGLIVVDGAVDGVHGPMILDTGDRSAFTVFQPFARANGLYDLQRSRHDVVTGVGIGGIIRGNVFGSTISVFGTDIPDVTTRAPLGPVGAFSSREFVGSVGNALLRRFNIVFRRSAKTVTTWPSGVNAISNAPVLSSFHLPRHGALGAMLGKSPQGALLLRVIPGSPAANAGLHDGDVVTSLSGESTPDTSAFLWQIHRHHANERVTVTLLRGRTSMSRDVTLGAAVDEDAAGLTTTYGSIVVDGTLRRTLITAPEHVDGRLPAMLILGGIGCYSIDVASNTQDSYLRLAHDVSKAGYVTMRVEKSGVGDSEGPPCQRVDFYAEQRAYAAALEALRQDPRVDPGRIVLFGHSIGSLEAPILANRERVAGVIVAEAVGRDWPEYEVRNARRQLELGGATAADVDQALVGKQECMVGLLLNQEPEDVLDRSGWNCSVHNGVYPVDPIYMQQIAPLNIIGQWNKISIPVLAIYGTSDFVTEEADHQRIVDVVNLAHPASASLDIVKGMDHLLDLAPTPEAALHLFSGTAPRQYDETLSKDVLSWLNAHSR